MPASPDLTLLLFTLGVLLVYVELNRPGKVLPGAAGLTLILLMTARALRIGISMMPAAACVLAGVLFMVSTRTRRRVPLVVLATSALFYGFVRLVPASSQARPHGAVALLCALLLGAGTSLLTTIAARARQNKGLDLK